MDRAAAIAATRALLDEHGLTDWWVSLSNAKNTLGSCHYKAKLIKLSGPYVDMNSAAEVQTTIIHEVAHALTPGAKHGRAWKIKARSMGLVNPTACVSGASIVTAPRRFEATCSECGRVVGARHIVTAAAREWTTRCHHAPFAWRDLQTGRPVPFAPAVAARRVAETPLDLDYSSMTPGQKAAYTKRMRARMS